MAIQYNENIQIAAPNPLDRRYLSTRTLAGSQLPYSAVTEVNNTIPQTERYSGLTVNVGGAEYWYNDGVTNNSLVIKTSLKVDTVTGATNGLTKVGNNIKLGGSLTGNTVIDLNDYHFEISNSNVDFITTNGFNNYVQTLQLQTDGKILVGGNFTTYSGVTANRIIRLNSDGRVDASFNSGLGFDYSVVNSIQLQSDDKILVGGDFTTYNGATANRIIRLNPDGSRDNTFNLGLGFDSTVNSIQLQSDGKILVGGYFTSYSGVIANRIVRLNEDGTIDNTFNSGLGFNDNVQTLQLQTDGNILVGGSFTTYSGVTANYIIRLNSNGSIDNTFNSGLGFNNYVQTLQLQTDGKILVGGNFTTYSGVTANKIIRLNSNGSIDNTFNSGDGFNNSSTVLSIQLQTDDKILVGGSFTTYSGVTANYIIRLNSNGSIDNTFNSGDGFDRLVRSIQLQTDGRILVGSQFSSYNEKEVFYFIRLNTDGSIDNTFNLGAQITGRIYSIFQQSDDKILVGGQFNNLNIRRLNINGNVDNTFNIGIGFDNIVQTLQQQTDGKILVGGTFTTYSGATANYIIRLNSNGSIDNTFNSGLGFDSTVNSIQLQSDGKILVGGYFTSYSGVTANRIVRLNTDGSIDNTFNSGLGFDDLVYSIQLQTDGKILVGGYFTTYSGVTANYIIRLNSNGSIDNTFNIGTGFNSNVNLIIQQTDGRILVGGWFTTYSGVTANYIIRLNSNGSIDNTFNIGTGFNSAVNSIQLQSDGKILVGGVFTTYDETTANRIIRLNSNGSIDNTFNIGTGFNSGVYSLQLQTDGKILVGGQFSSYNEASANYIIRLNSDGNVDGSISNIFRFSKIIAEYGEDYSLYYKVRSIPDVGYISNTYYNKNEVNVYTGDTNTRISDIEIKFITGATNGLSKTGKDIKLGGSLTGNTVIDLNSNNLEIFNRNYFFPLNVGFGDYVRTIELQSDNKILVGGSFTTYSGVTTNRIVRLNSDGIRDSTFNIGIGFDNIVQTLQLQTDNKILVGGSFTSYSGVTRNRIIRLNSNGNIDSTFNIGVGFNSGQINSLQLQTDSKILVGGTFTTYSGVTVNRIIRLNSNGSRDNTFTLGTGFNSTVQTLQLQTDGKILVGGNFTTYSGVTRNRIIRLNSNGSRDNTFNIGTGFNTEVYSLQLQSDNKILVGGSFTTYSGVTANRIIRLNSDGSRDNTFTLGTGFNGNVYSIKLQSDGKILVGGSFTSYSGVTVNRIIRLNSNGTIDNTLNSTNGFGNGSVRTIQLQTQDKMLIGGEFTTYSGVTANRIIRLNSNGTINNVSLNNIFRFNKRVVEYGEDNSQYYTARSIPDVAFVTGRTSGNTGDKNNIYSTIIITGNTTLTTGSTYAILVNSPTSIISITLPLTPINGEVFRIKDVSGKALTYNITINGNGRNIDGSSTALINTDYGAVELLYNSSLNAWFALSFML